MQTNRFQIVQLVLNLVLIGLLVVVLSTNHRAMTVSAADPRVEVAAPVPGGPGYVMVPATAFIPESPSDNYTVFWGDLSVPAGTLGTISVFNAPVYLPQGATLTKITLYYHDTNNDSYTLGVDFMRKPLPSSSSGESLGLSVYSNQTGWGLNQSDTTPDPTRAVVDNSQYSYWLSVYIQAAPSYLQVQAVRIDYAYRTSMPLISQ